MIQVDYFIKCKKCEKLSEIENVYVAEEYDEILFKKEYKCDCGYITIASEIIEYKFNI